MNQKLFEQIHETIKTHKGLSHQLEQVLTTKYPNENPATLFSIISHYYQRKMKANYVKTEETATKFWEEYQQAIRQNEPPGIILKLACSSSICPCLVAKLILYKFLGLDGLDFKTNNLNPYLRDTKTITDPRLSNEVFLCTIYDTIYSPLADAARHTIGQQYELKLYREAKEMGLVFRNEEELRQRGFDKTPDIKLEIPIAVDGFIVHWIESKALFGDPITHKEYTQQQYLSYWNRFGTGLVIYWLGYCQEILLLNDDRFLIRDQFKNCEIRQIDIEQNQ